MTTAASGIQRISACDGVTLDFSCPQFRKNAELQVWLLDSATQDPATGGLLGEGADYSITGSPSAGTAIVHTSVALPAGKFLCRRRATSRAQQVVVSANQGIPAATQQDALDRAALVDEEIEAKGNDTSSRAIMVAPGETCPPLDKASLRVGTILGFNYLTGARELLTYGQAAALIKPALGGNFKGDPGGNVLAIGTFAAAPGLTIPAGSKMVALSGTTVDGDTGAGRLFVEAAEVNAAYVTANPTIAFRDVAGRGFREVHRRSGRKLAPRLFVITGQSNGEGANTGANNPNNAKLYTWDPVAGALVQGGQYNANPWLRGAPDGNSGNNNFILGAAHRVAEDDGDPIYIVYDALGGQSIDQWVGAGTASARYAALKIKINAVLALTPFTTNAITTIDRVVFAQGEEDFTSQFATHLGKLVTLDTQWRAETFFTEFTPVHVMGMSNLHERYEVSKALREFCRRSNGRWQYVSSRGLKTLFDATGAGDYTHWLASSLWEGGYNRLGPAIVAGSKIGDDIPTLPYFNRGNGGLTPGDANAIATYSSFTGYDCRTGGPGVNDPFVGDGATTVFVLTVRGTVDPATGVTVNGVAKVAGVDYNITQAANDLPVLTFTAAPANLAAILVTYASATNGPGGLRSYSIGYRCNASGDYSLAGGYLSYVPLGLKYCFIWGRGGIASVDGEAQLGLFPKYIDGSRKFQYGIGTSRTNRKNALGVAAAGNVEILAPAGATDPGQNEELTFKLTTNTNLQIRARGADGTVRSANIVLA